MLEVVFDKFAGVNEAIPGDLLPVDHLVEMTNMVIDQTGENYLPVKRGGFVYHNAIPGSNIVSAIFELKDEAGTVFLGAQAGNVILETIAGHSEWSEVDPGFTSSEKMNCLSLGAGKYLVNNTEDFPVVIFGNSFSNVVQSEIAPPHIDGITISCDVSGGELSAGRYRYVLVYKTETGDVSNPSQPFANAIDDDGNSAIAGTKLTLCNLPVSTDARVSKKYLFRTKALTNSDNHFVFYFRSLLDNNETTFEDGAGGSDELLGSEEVSYHNHPFRAKVGVIHQSMLFLGNVTIRKRNYFAPAKIVAPSTAVFRAWRDEPAESGPYGNANYKYLAVFVDEKGDESASIETPAYRTNDEALRRVDLAAIPPAGEMQTGLPVVKRRIYRTKGDGVDFFKLKDIGLDGNILPEGDTTNDYDLGAKYTATPAFCEHKSGLVFSAIDTFSTFPNENLIEVFPDDLDEITALISDSDGLLIFKRRSICKLYTQSAAILSWRLLKIHDGVGCDLPDSIVKANGEIYFISRGKFFCYSAGHITDITKAFEVSFGNIDLVRCSLYFSVKSWVVIACRKNSIPAISFIIIYDTLAKVFYKFIADDFETLSVNVSEFGNETLLASKNEYILRYNESAVKDFTGEDDGKDIIVTLQTAVISSQEKFSNLRLRKLFLNYIAESGTVIHSIVSGEDIALSKSVTFSHTSGGRRISKLAVDSMQGSFLRGRKFYYRLSGSGLRKLNSVKINFKDERRY